MTGQDGATGQRTLLLAALFATGVLIALHDISVAKTAKMKNVTETIAESRAIGSQMQNMTATKTGKIAESRAIGSQMQNMAATKTGMIAESGSAFATKVKSITYKLRPSDITGHLVNQFRVCGRCPGKAVQVGPVVICPEVLQSTAHVLYYGASGWTDVGLHLSELELKSGAEGHSVNSTIHDCFTELEGLPVSVQLKKSCLYEQHPGRFPAIIGRLTPRGVDVTGILNLKSLEWRFLHEANQRKLQQYQMLIIKFYSLENQAKHLLYLQVLEKLLTHFDLISTNASACGSWGIPGQSFLMPTVLWATFLRKDLVKAPMATCDTQIPIQNCSDGQAAPSFRADFSMLPGERLGEPEDLIFEVYAQTYHHENPELANYLIPFRAVSLNLLSTFRLCNACRSGNLERIGPPGDGGYVICQEAAMGSSVAISIGIRGNDPFGSDLSERFGLRVEGFDCTGEAYECPRGSRRCKFTHHPKCIGKPFGDKEQSEFTTINKILNQYTKPTEEPILKIDCDGCEWLVLSEIPIKVLRRFRMLVMEAHWLEKQENHPRYLGTMQKLLQVFELVHSHTCNAFGVWTVNGTDFGMPRIVELTFVRKDYAKAIACVNSTYENGLDFQVARRYPEIGAEAFRLPNR